MLPYSSSLVYIWTAATRETQKLDTDFRVSLLSGLSDFMICHRKKAPHLKPSQKKSEGEQNKPAQRPNDLVTRAVAGHSGHHAGHLP